MDKAIVLKSIYDLSDATSAKEVHEILSRFKAPPVDVEEISENLEDIIQEAIQSLLDLLKKINAQEEKGAIVSGEDNNILELGPNVMVPLPPGTEDPNETGIPDNSIKTADTSLSGQIPQDPDNPPYIENRPYPFQIGDYVSWEGPIGRSYGRIEDLRLAGAEPIADSPLEMLATHEDPVCIVRIWRNDKGQGWLPGDTTTPIKMSALHKIDPLEPPQGVPPSMPNTQGKSLEEIISAKKLAVKAAGGQLRGSFRALIKAVSSEDVQAYRMSAEDEGDIGAEWIPDGSIVRDIIAADLLEDRGFERFLPKGLEDLSSHYPGKPMLLDHDWSAHQIVGKVLKSYVQDGKLVLRSYFANTDKNKWVVDGIRSAMFTMVSVGFAASPEDMVCSACSRSMFDSACKHQPGDVLKDGSRVNLLYKGVADAFECSIIPVPMQPGAHIMPAKALHLDTSDTIPLGTSTIGNSLKMTDNLSGIAPVGTEATASIDLAATPGAADATPPTAPATTEMSAPPETPPTAPETKDADTPPVGPSIEDVHKMIGEMRTVQEGMCQKMDELATTANDIHGKTSELLGTFKATPASSPVEAIGEMLKEFGAQFTVALDKLDAQKKELEAVKEENTKSLADLHKKLDVAMTATTEGVMKLLLEENVPEAPRTQAKKNIWVHDFFGVKEDQGGQN